ncbi:unnamed protein product, partial [Polarella glacialis]
VKQLRRPVGSQRKVGQIIYRVLTPQAGQLSCKQSSCPPATPTSPPAMRELPSIRHNHNNNTNKNIKNNNNNNHNNNNNNTQAPVVPPPVWRTTRTTTTPPTTTTTAAAETTATAVTTTTTAGGRTLSDGDPRNDPWKVSSTCSVRAVSAGSPSNGHRKARSGKQKDDAGKGFTHVAPWNSDVHTTAP